MRLLLAARLSVTVAGQTGIETQDQHAREWAEREGHEIVAVAADRGTSGKVPPRKRRELGPWLTDPARLAQYDGIVSYSVDRISRDFVDTPELRKWALERGKWLFVVKDGLRWSAEDQSQGMVWAVYAERANDEWGEIRERSMRAQAALRERGALVGRPPFGYAAAGERGARSLAPTDEGRKYVPEVFRRVIAGESLARVAAWLDGEGVRAGGERWWPRTVGQLVRCPTYKGRRADAAGRVIHECEPLVDALTFKRAGLALDGRPKRGPARPERRAMLAGAVFCPRCEDSPMYRIGCGAGAGRSFYYRCAGRGAQRKGCGNMVPLARADAAVEGIAARTFGWRKVTVAKFVAGSNHEAELEAVRDEMRQLALRDLPDAEHDAELARLRGERDRLAALPCEPDRTVEVETGQTYAELWAGVPRAERGPWLARHGFRVTADRSGVTLSQPGHPRAASVTAPLAQADS